MSKTEKKLQAHKLRRAGHSIGAIAEILKVSKGSVSLWCSNLFLTARQKELIRRKMIREGHRGRMIGAEINRKKKLTLIQQGIKEGKVLVSRLSKREMLISGTALFWAEGTKKGNKLTFSNSDPAMIIFMFRWFKECMGVSKHEFMPRIFINQIHGPRIKDVVNFWSEYLNLPIEQFGRPILLKMKQVKKYENYDKYYGVLQLGISRPSRLKHKVLGLVEALKTCHLSR